MAEIHSPNAGFKRIEVPSESPTYVHPIETERGATPGVVEGRKAIPMAFQVTSPVNHRRVLLPHALVLHVNPSSLNESHRQKMERIQTRGGWVEQHWGHELVEISADQSTGAFMHIRTGLTSVLRQRTIAWDLYRDLHDLYLNNGSVYDPSGSIVLQGHLMLMFDRGVYLGEFDDFSVSETDETPFSFALAWTFTVKRTITQVSGSIWDLRTNTERNIAPTL